MEIDRYLSYWTRAINRLLPTGRRLGPMKEWFARRYARSGKSWAIISDYRGRLKMKLDRAGYIGSTIYWHGYHHGPELAYIEQKLRPADVVVDAGANIGEFSIALAARVPAGRVLAFEPQSDIRQVLEENIALNGFNNVDIFAFGLADSTYDGELYINDKCRGPALKNEGLYTRYPVEDGYESAGVASFRSLDSVIAAHGVDRVDWMKIDIEGGELAMLKGARRTLEVHRPKLLIEINEQSFNAAGYTAKDVLALLQEFAYHPFGLDSAGNLVRSALPDLKGSSNLFFLSCDH